jgi:ABC-2 type transport system ATP-binding protein
MNAIETHQLRRRYGRADALHGLDLEVPRGSIFALIGPNGAGKTTTIKVLMNLLEPTGGSALVLGVDSRRLSPREREHIGYVSENQRLPEWMTVDQLMRFCRPFYPNWDRSL